MKLSLHRFGIVAATAAVAATVAGALVLEGYGSAAAQAPVPAAAKSSATLDPTLEPETIYVRPAGTPKVIHVTVPATAQPGKRPVIHVVVPSQGGDDGHDSGGDD